MYVLLETIITSNETKLHFDRESSVYFYETWRKFIREVLYFNKM